MDLSYILNSPDVERVAGALELLANNSGKTVLTDSMKMTLLNMFQHVAYTDAQGKTYYDALVDALFSGGGTIFPRLEIVYDPGTHMVYTDDTLDSLRPYLTVKWRDSAQDSGSVITNYTLSGTLEAGTSTVVVGYGNYYKSFYVPGVIEVGSVNYASDLANWEIKKTRDDGTIVYDGSKWVIKIDTQAGANSYGFAVWDTQETLYSAIKGKKVRIRFYISSPDWSGTYSGDAPVNRVTTGFGIYDGNNPSTRLRWRGLYYSFDDAAHAMTSNPEKYYDYVATITDEWFNTGTGVITEESTVGAYLYVQTLNTVYLNGVEIKEILD